MEGGSVCMGCQWEELTFQIFIKTPPRPISMQPRGGDVIARGAEERYRF